jgi:hypothetical protein
VGAAGTGAGVLGAAALTAGLMICQFVAWLRGEHSACDITIQLPASADHACV